MASRELNAGDEVFVYVGQLSDAWAFCFRGSTIAPETTPNSCLRAQIHIQSDLATILNSDETFMVLNGITALVK